MVKKRQTPKTSAQNDIEMQETPNITFEKEFAHRVASKLLSDSLEDRKDALIEIANFDFDYCSSEIKAQMTNSNFATSIAICLNDSNLLIRLYSLQALNNVISSFQDLTVAFSASLLKNYSYLLSSILQEYQSGAAKEGERTLREQIEIAIIESILICLEAETQQNNEFLKFSTIIQDLLDIVLNPEYYSVETSFAVSKLLTS